MVTYGRRKRSLAAAAFTVFRDESPKHSPSKPKSPQRTPASQTGAPFEGDVDIDEMEGLALLDSVPRHPLEFSSPLQPIATENAPLLAPVVPPAPRHREEIESQSGRLRLLAAEQRAESERREAVLASFTTRPSPFQRGKAAFLKARRLVKLHLGTMQQKKDPPQQEVPVHVDSGYQPLTLEFDHRQAEIASGQHPTKVDSGTPVENSFVAEIFDRVEPSDAGFLTAPIAESTPEASMVDPAPSNNPLSGPSNNPAPEPPALHTNLVPFQSPAILENPALHTNSISFQSLIVLEPPALHTNPVPFQSPAILENPAPEPPALSMNPIPSESPAEISANEPNPPKVLLAPKLDPKAKSPEIIELPLYKRKTREKPTKPRKALAPKDTNTRLQVHPVSKTRLPQATKPSKTCFAPLQDESEADELGQ